MSSFIHDTFDTYYKQNKKKYWKMAQFKLALANVPCPANNDLKKRALEFQAQKLARQDYEIFHQIS